MFDNNEAVRFQKEMRPVSLETPEPDETGHQNLMRPNTGYGINNAD
jgi:hypothetical protein